MTDEDSLPPWIQARIEWMENILNQILANSEFANLGLTWKWEEIDD